MELNKKEEKQVVADFILACQVDGLDMGEVKKELFKVLGISDCVTGILLDYGGIEENAVYLVKTEHVERQEVKWRVGWFDAGIWWDQSTGENIESTDEDLIVVGWSKIVGEVDNQ